jgi:hypothetical protein
VLMMPATNYIWDEGNLLAEADDRAMSRRM